MQTSTNNQLHDLTIVEKMCRGKMEKIIDMVKTFLRTMPEAMNDLNRQCSNNDLDAVQNVIHRIKPTLSFYGIVSLSQVVTEIEQMETCDRNRLDSLVLQIETVTAQVMHDLKKEYQLN